MVRRPGFICSVLLASLLVHAAAAYGAPGDPEAGSPSGGVYELPLEKGRADAAPGSGGTAAPEPGAGGGSETGSGAGGGEDESSFYRSENNFGSSSHVPGTGGGGAGGADGEPGAGGAGAKSGGGDGGAGGAGAETEAEPLAAEVPDTGNTSVAGNLALLAAIAVLVAAVGVFVARRRVRPR